MSHLRGTNEILAREVLPYSGGDDVTEVVISFTPHQTYRELLKDPAARGAGFYLVYDHGEIVYMGATVRLRTRAREHISRKGFRKNWTYRVAYPNEALGRLLYPYALAYYRKHGDAYRIYYRRGMTPREAACRDTRPPPHRRAPRAR
jgi:hypothetical protein